MRQTVTALLVSHDGATWLPDVLAALTAQTRPPDRVLVLDTGSVDETASILARDVPDWPVLALDPATGYPDAVAAGLRETAPTNPDERADPTSWVWLLHDDGAPSPDCLQRLLETASREPGVDLLGPKLRRWPAGEALLEVGVTLSGTGRRESGLEPEELDQGQHDQAREVLAVNTAGLLVRRTVLDELGLDPALPVLGTDLDLGWRAARAGHRTLVAPAAVLFHVEAARHGLRETTLTGPRVRRTERAAALHTLLANASAGSLPWRWVRLALGTVLRTLGLLLVRAPGAAYDEVVAAAAVLGRPDRLASARRWRAKTAAVPHREVRHLLAPFWVPYRHGLDAVTEAVSPRLRALRHTGAGVGPTRPGGLTRALGRPAILVGVLLVLVTAWNLRGLVGDGSLSGGALLAAPDSATHWWVTYLAPTHDLDAGSAAPAFPALAPLAVAGALLAGKAWLVVDVLLLLSVPLAALGARRLLGALTDSAPAALWGAVAYGMLPVLTGAVQQGRLGTVVVTVLLPWLARSALRMGPDHPPEQRHRAAWRSAAWLALAAAFAPLTWLLALAVWVLATPLGWWVEPRWRRSAAWILPLVPVLATPVLLLPWSLTTPRHAGWASWLDEIGVDAGTLVPALRWSDVVLARPGGDLTAAAPWWALAGVTLAAVAALLRPDTRGPVLGAWCVLVVALGSCVALGTLTVRLGPEVDPHRVWLGVPLVLAQGAAVCAAAIAGSGIRTRLAAASFGWRQPLGAVVVALALASPVAAVAWWAVTGTGGPLERRAAPSVPAYMTQAAESDPAARVLLLRGSTSAGFDQLVTPEAGLRLGDESVLPTVAEQQPLTDLVTRVVVDPRVEDVSDLAGYGVRFVYAPPPADPALARRLDAAAGLVPASASGAGARAWRLTDVGADAPRSRPDPDTVSRWWLVAGQGLAVLVVAVLAGPSRRQDR